ncbi:MAG TPA: lysine--tRNA ligase, partial [Thiothrix sp.]|nr:lysine--tRNA ligase [Thiothrix sp.]
MSEQNPSPNSKNTLKNDDDNQLIQQRREKLTQLREKQTSAFPNDFNKTHYANVLHVEYDEHDKPWFEENSVAVNVAGRMMLKRVMGKASFITLSDTTGRIQLFVQKNNIGEEAYADFKTWDVGDIVGGEGLLFKTKTGELSVKVSRLQLLTKSLRPLPEKFHGLTDHEQRYRQRYIDLIMNEETRHAFMLRSMIVSY